MAEGVPLYAERRLWVFAGAMKAEAGMPKRVAKLRMCGRVMLRVPLSIWEAFDLEPRSETRISLLEAVTGDGFQVLAILLLGAGDVRRALLDHLSLLCVIGEF